MNNLEIVQAVLEKFGEGDFEGMAPFLSEQMSYSITLSPNHPHYEFRTGYGKSDFLNFLVMTGRDVERREFELSDFMVSEDKVSILGHGKHMMKSIGKEAENDFVYVFDVIDGKITRFREYFDSAMVQRAYDA